MLKNNNGFYKKKIIASFFVFILFASFFMGAKKAEAQMFDPAAFTQRIIDNVIQVEGVVLETKKTIWQKIAEKLEKIGSSIYQKTLTFAVNTIAYDAANFITTGKEGRKELFTTDYFVEVAKNTGDAAIGEFIDGLYKEWQVDLCNPSLDVKARIGLGLKAQQKPQVSSSCGWQQLKAGWTSEYDRWKSITEDQNYLNKVSSMFDPTGNDLSIALDLFGRTEEVYNDAKEKEEKQLALSEGWLDVRDIGGRAASYPGEVKNKLKLAQELQYSKMGEFTGEALLDASNIFINQLGISSFNALVSNMGKWLAKSEDPESPEDPTEDPDLDTRAYRGGNYLTTALKKIITPRFDVKVDFDILTDLVTCVDADNPLPNNCVISDRFSQAIQNKNTVIEAINNGYLNPNMIFDKGVDYQNGFNERNLLILRKFRIVPLGWEEALTRAEIKKAETQNKYTLMDMVSCFSPYDEFDTFSEGFVRSGFTDYSWCEGLVDPNWVLKAPLNKCAKEGYGGYLMVKQIVEIPDISNMQTTTTVDTSKIDPIIISRAENYCADEQSCIKENSDGSCDFYGYCTEEKRIWDFDQDSCDPVYNTCESFTSVSQGKKLALLKNTIDYDACSSENVGCLQYSLGGSYNTSTSLMAWNNYPLVYFNNKVESCSSSNEGCSEYLRTDAGVGHNFLINGDFEKPLSVGDWDNNNVATSSIAYSGDLSILLSSESLSKSVAVAPSNYLVSGESYTLSFYSLCSGNGTSTVSLGNKNQNIINNEGFSYQAITNVFPDNYNFNTVGFNINPNGNECLIDNIKLEKGTVGTYYSNYRENALVYQKTIPEYLKNTCYQDPYSSSPNYRLKSDAPSVCYNYARLCNNNEIGCNLFTSIYNIKTAAKVLDKDYCPDQCVGYDVYVQNKTLFENKAVAKFIPASARTCGASDVGCAEFTNLDEVASGGEGKEYYTYLKHCIKPTQGTCESFYSWQGSDESGYQLKSFSLEKDSSGSKPKLTDGIFISDGVGIFVQAGATINPLYGTITVDDGPPLCDENIYNLSPSDPLYNFDCREFYNQDGQKFYTLYSKTITCSEGCKTYRMSDKNVDIDINNSADCSGDTRHWNGEENVCYDCLAGGKWDNTQAACIYQAIPGEGQTCNSGNNGCREYNGNSGQSVRNIASYDFNNGLNSWEGDVTSSLESLNQNGKSMKLSGQGKVKIGYSVTKGSSYILKFLARSNQNKDLKIYFSNEDGSSTYFGPAGIIGQDNISSAITIPFSDDWKLYQVNLENLDHDITAEEVLRISAFDLPDNEGVSGDVYISNINLLEINSRYYLIKDSWNTPGACYYDTTNVYQGVNYNLGCQSYNDKNSKNHNLRQFNSLCDSSAVGCEMVIDTHNYSSPYAKVFNDDNENSSCEVDEVDCLNIPADNFVAMVYDASKACSAGNKGCSRLGKTTSANPSMVAQNLYSDIYIKNNPDKYNSILCQQDEAGCDAWSSLSGTAYFKDPGDNLCLWRKGVDSNSNYAWYKKAVKKCKAGDSFTNNICNSSSDCSDNQTCELDTADYLCPAESRKTIGLGGNSPIYQPTKEFGINWAGACPIAQSGCTEYLDPSSSFSQNLVHNPNFADLNGDGVGFDGWSSVNTCVFINNSFSCLLNSNHSYVQYVQESPLSVGPNKLYILKTNGPQSATLECSSPIYELKNDNKLSLGTTTLSVEAGNVKKIFYSGDNNNSCTIRYKLNNDYIQEVMTTTQFDDLQLQGYFNNQSNSSKFASLNKLLKIKSAQAQGEDYSIEVKEVIMDYQLKQNLDFSSCNGQADFNTGCIVFNEREVNSGQFSSLNFNSLNYSNYSTCSGDECDANSLLKVKPDRTCGKWLSCYSYTFDPFTNERICLEMAECTAFNYDGSCFNFIRPENGVRNYTPGRDNNATGYSVLGMQNLANMHQLGEDQDINDGKSFDFESPSDVNEDWKKTEIPNSFLSTTTCWINGPSSKNMGSYVSYPAHGLGFLKIGGNNCGKNYFVVSKDLIEVPVKASYYLSFKINTEELALSEKAEFKVIGVTENFEEVWSVPTSTVDRKNGWQDISFKFRTEVEWGPGVKLAMKSSNGGVFYIDNIRIEPVLEVLGDKNYLQSICRLFPGQDSLTCETENKNFVKNGWYGYCLQKDPKNSDVCLLWYPVDSVKGNKGLGQAESGFPGYEDTGVKPYYCAEMSANFDLVEYRDVYYSGMNKGWGAASYHGYSWTNVIMDSGNWCNENYYNMATRLVDYNGVDCYKAFIEDSLGGSPDTFHNEIRYCLPKADNLIIKTNTETLYATTIQTELQNNGTTLTPDTRLCCTDAITSDATAGKCGVSSGCNMLRCNYSGNDDNFEYKSNMNLCYHSNTWRAVASLVHYSCIPGFDIHKTQAGWYKYDGNLLDKTVGGSNVETKVKLLAYDYTEDPECSLAGGELHELVGGGKACLMDLNQYVPKCTKVIQGETPWVQRLITGDNNLTTYIQANLSSADLSDYNSNFNYSPYGVYKRELASAPFGAIIVNDDSLSASSKVYAGGQSPSGDKYYGIPYSCNSYGREIEGEKSCAYLYLDGNKIKVWDPTAPGANFTNYKNDSLNYDWVSTDMGDSYQDNTLGTAKKLQGRAVTAFKNIFLKVKGIIHNKVNGEAESAEIGDLNYNFTKTGASAIEFDEDRDDPLLYKAVIPKIDSDKIVLTDRNGTRINKNTSTDTYIIHNSGFYNLTLNTEIDDEQAPIDKLIVRVKDTSISSWNTNVGRTTRGPIDSLPDVNNPHRFGMYLYPGTYQILVKVVDNWGFYKCVGSNKFDNMPAIGDCPECCKSGFLDPDIMTDPFSVSNYCYKCFHQ